MEPGAPPRNTKREWRRRYRGAAERLVKIFRAGESCSTPSTAPGGNRRKGATHSRGFHARSAAAGELNGLKRNGPLHRSSWQLRPDNLETEALGDRSCNLRVVGCRCWLGRSAGGGARL